MCYTYIYIYAYTHKYTMYITMYIYMYIYIYRHTAHLSSGNIPVHTNPATLAPPLSPSPIPVRHPCEWGSLIVHELAPVAEESSIVVEPAASGREGAH
jgi:hypothetical protein